MKTHPIIFSAPMVRALLAGRKTQTRRLAWGKPVGITSDLILDYGYRGYLVSEPQDEGEYDHLAYPPSPWKKAKPGDRLWVREAWKPHSSFAGMKPREMPPSKVFYSADDGYAPSNTPWVPSIHMPRWASRLTLEVTGVKVERLQDISETDARAEGITDGGCLSCGMSEPCGCERSQPDARDSFAHLWNSLHGAEAWAANPEVVALSFTVRHGNIDRLIDEAA